MRKLQLAVVTGLVAAVTTSPGHLTVMQAQTHSQPNSDMGLMTPQQLKQFAVKVRQAPTQKDAFELLLKALDVTPTQRKLNNVFQAQAKRRIIALGQPLGSSKKPLSKQQKAKLASQVTDIYIQSTKQFLAVLTPAQHSRFNQIMFAPKPKAS